MGFLEVKKELQKLDSKELIKHISELYKKFPAVKEYFDFFISTNEEELLDRYKSKVREGIFPKRGYELKLSISRKAINDFKKLGTSSEAIGHLMLYYVQCGVDFTNDFGDIDEPFYTSMENTYAKALELLSKESSLEKLNKQAKKIVDDSSETGWGFGDYLADVYYSHYSD